MPASSAGPTVLKITLEPFCWMGRTAQNEGAGRIPTQKMLSMSPILLGQVQSNLDSLGEDTLISCGET